MSASAHPRPDPQAREESQARARRRPRRQRHHGLRQRRAVHPGRPRGDVPRADQGEGRRGPRRRGQAGALAHRRLARRRSATTTHDLDAGGRRGGPHLRGADRGLRHQEGHVRQGRDGPPRRLDRRHGDLGPLDQRALRGPQRLVPQELPRAALLQSAERDRGHRADRRRTTPTRSVVDFIEAFSPRAARPRDGPHRRHAGLRRQSRRASRC